MDYMDRPVTKEERWEYWVGLRGSHDDLDEAAQRDLVENCMIEWDISKSARKKYLKELFE